MKWLKGWMESILGEWRTTNKMLTSIAVSLTRIANPMVTVDAPQPLPPIPAEHKPAGRKPFTLKGNK